MKALSVLQPWTAAIFWQGKAVENRTWFTSYRGSLLIHAGKSDRLYRHITPDDWRRAFGVSIPDRQAVTLGGIVGVVEVWGCVRPAECPGPWTEGPWCWQLRNPRVFDRPIPFAGKQGLFDVPDHLVAHLLTPGGHP